MTQIAAQAQIKAIQEATREASKSPETARQFLVDAGILKVQEPTKHTTIQEPKKERQ